MRFAAGIEYQGGGFCGWQRQLNATTSIQEALEQALSAVADEPIEVVCAGRTDKGVHATGQVIHFDTTRERSLDAWRRGTNTSLPPTVRIQWVCAVPETFHARHRAVARTYRYFIQTGPRSAFSVTQLTSIPYRLDETLMHQAAQSLVGEHDFSSFRASSCQSKSPVRTVHFVRVERHGTLIVVEIKANAFLHHMVRNIVGTLLAVGSGKADQFSVAKILEARDRQAAAPTASPDGLYLCKVDYPADYAIPLSAEGPWFFAPYREHA